MAVSGWARQQGRTYFDNASAKRDFRSQLRGTRAMVLLGSYLLAVIVSAWAAYKALDIGNSLKTLQDAQTLLRGFYGGMLALLGGLAAFVATAYGATSVVMERQRKALDLVMAAPVTPKYYLVGKLISSYRLTWMMLSISLPALAVGSVLGGVSWQYVLSGFWVVSLDCLVLAAVAIAISASTRKPAYAILFSFVVNGVIASCSTAMGSAYSSFSGLERVEQTAPLAGMFSPFVSGTLAETVSYVFGHPISNVLLLTLAAIPCCWIVLVAGGAGLSEKSVRETKILRGTMLALVAVLEFCLFNQLDFEAPRAGQIFLVCITPMWVIIPYIACYGADAEEKFQAGGNGRWSNALEGRPASTLSYLVSCLIVALIGAIMGLFTNRQPTFQEHLYPQPSVPAAMPSLLGYALWALGLAVIAYAVCKAASMITSKLRDARALSLVIMAAFLVPCAVIVTLTAQWGWDDSPLSFIFPFAVLGSSPAPYLALGQGIGMLLLSRGIQKRADRFVRERARRRLFESGASI